MTITLHPIPFAIVLCCVSLLIADCIDGDLKLVNGSSMMEGRVEICRNNTFGTICDRHWDILDIKVACKKLGFSDTSKS